MNKSDSKLSSIIKEERELYNKKDIEDPQIVSLYIISSLKKLLITPLTHKEFLSVFNTANENTFEVALRFKTPLNHIIKVLIREQRIKMYHQIQNIVKNLFSERLYNITQIKKEMNSFTILSKQRIGNILNDIDECKDVKLSYQFLVKLLE